MVSCTIIPWIIRNMKMSKIKIPQVFISHVDGEHVITPEHYKVIHAELRREIDKHCTLKNHNFVIPEFMIQ